MNQNRKASSVIFGISFFIYILGLISTGSGIPTHTIHIDAGASLELSCNTSLAQTTEHIMWVWKNTTLVCSEDDRHISSDKTHFATCNGHNIITGAINESTTYTMYTEDIYIRVNLVCSVNAIVKHKGHKRMSPDIQYFPIDPTGDYTDSTKKDPGVDTTDFPTIESSTNSSDQRGTIVFALTTIAESNNSTDTIGNDTVTDTTDFAFTTIEPPTNITESLGNDTDIETTEFTFTTTDLPTNFTESPRNDTDIDTTEFTFTTTDLPTDITESPRNDTDIDTTGFTFTTTDPPTNITESPGNDTDIETTEFTFTTTDLPTNITESPGNDTDIETTEFTFTTTDLSTNITESPGNDTDIDTTEFTFTTDPSTNITESPGNDTDIDTTEFTFTTTDPSINITESPVNDTNIDTTGFTFTTTDLPTNITESPGNDTDIDTTDSSFTTVELVTNSTESTGNDAGIVTTEVAFSTEAPIDSPCSGLGNITTSYVLEEVIFPPSHADERSDNYYAWFSRSHQNKFDICYLKVLIIKELKSGIVRCAASSFMNHTNDNSSNWYGTAEGCVQEDTVLCLEVKHPGIITDGMAESRHMETVVSINIYDFGNANCSDYEMNPLLERIYGNTDPILLTYFPLKDLPYGPDFGIYCTKGAIQKDIAKERALNMCTSGTNEDDIKIDVTSFQNWAIKFMC